MQTTVESASTTYLATPRISRLLSRSRLAVIVANQRRARCTFILYCPFDSKANHIRCRYIFTDKPFVTTLGNLNDGSTMYLLCLVGQSKPKISFVTSIKLRWILHSRYQMILHPLQFVSHQSVSNATLHLIFR